MLRIRLGITLYTLLTSVLFATFSATFLSAADFTIPTGYIFEINDNTFEIPDEDINNTGSVTLHYGTITLGGDWSNSGYFSSSYGTVKLNSSSQAQSVTTGGTSSAFSTLLVTNSHSSGITFADALYCGTLTASSGVQRLSFGTSGVHTISSNFNVDGSSGNRITLTSAGAPSQWNLDTPMTGNYWVDYLDVSYSKVVPGKTIPAFHSVNGGNNVNWSFGPIVTTGAATNIGNTSATFNGTVIPNGTSTTVWFDYGQTSGSYTGSSTTQTGLIGTETVNVSINVSNLSSGTTYYNRLVATRTDYDVDVPTTWIMYESETSFTTTSSSSGGDGGGGGGGGGGSVTYISVTSTTPASGATGVAANSTISATFSETMNGSTLTTDSFRLTGGGNTVNGSVSTSGNKATFTPSSNLAYNTTYTVTITTDAKAANAASSALFSNYTWSFTTASPSDTTVPVGGITINNNASYTTTRDVTLNLSATDNTGVTGYSLSTNAVVPSATGTSWVSVTSAASFTRDVSYTLNSGDGSKTVYAFYKDAAGNISNPVSDSIILDTTLPLVVSTTPSSGTTSVAVNTTISALFSEAMDVSTIGTSTFFLSGGVTGTITTSTGTATTASFKPSNNLAYNTSYTVTVKKGASDLAGNSMASDYTWSFTTGSLASDTTAPVGGITINNDASYTTTRDVTLNLSATDNIGVTGYSLSTSTAVPSATSTSWVSVTPAASFTRDVSYTLGSGDGSKVVFAFYKDAAGNISNAYRDSIILDTIPPSVISTIPSGSATSVAVDTNISAIFSEAMDISTIGTSTFFLSGGATGTITTRTGTVTVATCLPSRELAYNTIYTTTITTGAKDKAGNALPVNVTWSFTTAGTMTTPIFTSTPTPTPTPMASPTPISIVADFTASPTTGIKPLTVQFTDQSVGNISKWKWDFGDGTTDSVQNPIHTYSNKGEYTVSLTVSGTYGSDTKIVKNCVTVAGKKTGALAAGYTASPTTGEWPLTVQFTDQSIGDISKWKWNFGDGTTDTAQNPSYTYNKSGDFTVSLTVSGKDGSTNTKTIDSYISVYRKKSSLELSLSPSEINFGESLTLQGNISPALQTEITLSLNSRNGGTDTAKTTSGTDGSFSLSDYYPPSGGSWNVTAKWEGNEKYQDTESDYREFTVNPIKASVSIEPSSSAVQITGVVNITGTITVTPDNKTTRERFLRKEVNLFLLTPDGKYEAPLPIHPVLSGDQPGCQWKDINLPEVGNWEVWAGFDTNESFIGTSSAHKEIEVQEAAKDVAGYAVLVEGYVKDGSGLDSHNLTANYIYKILLERGFTDDGIYYFNYNTAQNGVDEKPSKNGVLNAIKTWASGKMNKSPAPLYIIFVGHGEKGKLLLHPDILDAESLSSALDGKKGLKSLLNTNALNEPVIIIIGANHSGSFIDKLALKDTSGMKRVIVVSCDTEEVAYKGPLPPYETLRHGDYFLYEFMKYAGAGKTIKKSYELAAERIAAYTENENGNGLNGSSAGSGQYFDDAAQHPLLEDSGDGIGTYGVLSSSGSSDGTVASNLIVGFGTSSTLLELTEVSGAVTLTEDSVAELFAKVNNTEGVSAWVEIVSPNHRLEYNKDTTEQQAIDLPGFSYNDFSGTDKRYRWNDFSSGIFNNFSESGKYRVLYFARRGETDTIASLRTSEVFRDSWNNKPPTGFNPVFPVYGTETTVALIFDWEDSIDPDSDRVVTYDLTVSQDEDFTTVYYQRKGLKNSFAVVDRTASFRDDATYYWKVLASDADGGTTAMGTTTASASGSRILGYLIDDNRDPISSGEIRTRMLGASEEYVALSSEEGFFQFDNLQSGRYRLKAEKEYYRRYRDILELGEGETKYKEVMLKKLNGTDESPVYSLLWSGDTIYADGVSGKLDTAGEKIAEEMRYRIGSFEEHNNQEATVSPSSFKPKLANGYPGFIVGFVYDKETNAKLGSAAITIQGTKGSYSTTENGAYFLQLLSGTYEVSVNASGYKTAAESVRVDALSTTTKNIGLKKATEMVSISGQVTDAKKSKPLEGVKVTVKKKAFKKKIMTDKDGRYSVTDLESGKYTVTAAKKGYKRYRKNIRLKAGQDETLDIKLK